MFDVKWSNSRIGRMKKSLFKEMFDLEYTELIVGIESIDGE